MRRLHPMIIISSFSLWYPDAGAQTTDMSFNPDGYLSERYTTEAPGNNNAGGIRTEKINIGGSNYTKYTNERGALYIQKLERPDSDPEVYLRCGKDLNNHDEHVEHRIALERELTRNIGVDVSLASDIIVKRCGGIVKGLSSPAGEIGMTYKDKKGRNHRIFNRMLKPNLGFQSEF